MGKVYKFTKNKIMLHFIHGVVTIGMFIWGVFLGQMIMSDKHPPCGENMPTEVADMFTVRNDTLFIKQGVGFTISTSTMTLDTAGTIYRNK
jgi:hypothetical protein